MDRYLPFYLAGFFLAHYTFSSRSFKEEALNISMAFSASICVYSVTKAKPFDSPLSWYGEQGF